MKTSLDHRTDRKQQERGSPRPGLYAFLALVALAVAFRAEVFFSGAALIGFTYGGSEDSAAYLIYIGVVSGIGVLLGSIYILTRPRIFMGSFIALFSPLIILGLYLADSLFGRVQPQSGSHFLVAMAMAVPALVAGAVFSDPEVERRAAFPVEILMLMFSFAVALAAVDTLTGGLGGRGVGGATYQTAGYLGAVAFNINLYYVLFGRTGFRPKITRTRLYWIASLVLLPLQVVATLLTGARGAFVLLAIGSGAMLVIVLRARRGGVRARLLLAGLTLLPLVFVWLAELSERPEIAVVIDRVFSYVSPDGIDWSGTSGRDQVYAEAFKALDSAPFLGYGLFSWGGLDYYPHNFWLEVMLNGGVLYTFAWVLVCVLVACKALMHARRAPGARPMLMLALYPVVLLQFSGSYWTMGPFWFFIGYLLCVRARPVAHRT